MKDFKVNTTKSSGFQIHKNFSLCAIYVHPQCAYKKRLDGGWYFLNDKLIKDGNNQIILNSQSKVPEQFFGPNISIQAIVGTNGSGKSSVLELIYRLINNFSFMLEMQLRQNGKATSLCYVKGLKMTMYFILDGAIGTLEANDDNIIFQHGDLRKEFTFCVVNTGENARRLIGDNAPVKQLIEVARHFCYTVVTNYSMQSLIDQDYYEEKAYKVFVSKDIDKNYRNVIEREEGDVWISHIFHKNDGYRTPLVLNPFRDNGELDLVREYHLTLYRLSVLFIRCRTLTMELLENYHLDSIIYSYCVTTIQKKYARLWGNSAFMNFSWFSYQDIQHWNEQQKESVMYEILRCYKLTKVNLQNDLIRDACLYVIYKVLSIAGTYPYYSDYEDIGKINRPFITLNEKYTKKRVADLVSLIQKDHSHITIKLNQTLHFIELLTKIQGVKDVSMLKSQFTYNDYLKLLIETKIIDKEPSGLKDLMCILPPAFYDIDINLTKRGEAKSNSIKRMSSGERQFLYNSSVFVYHIMNLLSIQGSGRVAYRNFNLVLDEVELCYHPEYQRQFICKIVDLLRRLRLNVHSSINIIVATHSPFILSDIPQQNILYLKEGTSWNDKVNMNPFAANVNDILHQSFFLENGFIGEFAKKKVHDIIEGIEACSRDSNNQTLISLRERIDMIGDEFLRQQLNRLLDFNVAKKKYE